jgi:hypothetical protein
MCSKNIHAVSSSPWLHLLLKKVKHHYLAATLKTPNPKMAAKISRGTPGGSAAGPQT